MGLGRSKEEAPPDDAAIEAMLAESLDDLDWEGISLVTNSFSDLTGLNEMLKDLRYTDNEFVEMGDVPFRSEVHFKPPGSPVNRPGRLVQYNKIFQFEIRGVKTYVLLVDDKKYGKSYNLKFNSVLYRL